MACFSSRDSINTEGSLAMHDTIRKNRPKRVLRESVFRSDRFQEIAIVDSITAVRKVKRAFPCARLRKYVTLALRAIYIAAAEEPRAALQNCWAQASASMHASKLAAGDPFRLLLQHRTIMKVTALRAILLSFIPGQ